MQTLHEGKYPSDDVLRSPYIEQIRGLAVHPDTGVVYASDVDTPVILKLVPYKSAEVLAGNGQYGYSLGYRTSAMFNAPNALLFLTNETMLIADSGSNVILQMNLDGKVSAFAGSPTASSTKDGPLASASFTSPITMAKNANGSLVYVAQDKVIRELNLDTKMVSTIAGGTTTGYKDGPGKDARFNSIVALAVGPKSGYVFISDYYSNVIRVYFPSNATVATYAGSDSGYVDGPFSSAKFSGPYGLCIDPDENLYVADYLNNAIRKVGNDGIVSTLAGGEVSGYYDGVGKDSQLYWPTGMAIDSTGSLLYMGEFGNGDIRRLSVKSRFLTTFAMREGTGNQDGVGNSVRLNYPSFFGKDDAGNLYFSNIISSQIKALNSGRNGISTFAGALYTGFLDGIAKDALFNHLKGIAFYNGTFYVADSENHVIRAIAKNGTDEKYTVSTFSGSGRVGKVDGKAQQAQFNYPTCLVADSKGNLLVAEYYNCDVRKVDFHGSVTTYAGSSCGNKGGIGTQAQFSAIFGIAIDKDDNLWIAEYHNNQVRKIAAGTLAVTHVAGTAGVAGYKDGVGSMAKFSYPAQISLARNGDILMADTFNNMIRRVTQDGIVSTIAGSGVAGVRDGDTDTCYLKYPIGVIADPFDDDIIYVSEYGSSVIRKISLSKKHIVTVAGHAASPYSESQVIEDRLKRPQGLAIHPETGAIFYSNTGHHVIGTIGDSGGPEIVAGRGSPGWYEGAGREAEFNGPKGLCFVRINGNWSLIVADSQNHLIRRINMNGKSVISLTGTGFFGSSRNVELNDPNGVVFQATSDSIFISDTSNNVIKRMSLVTRNVTVVAGSGQADHRDDIGLKARFNHPSGLALFADTGLLVADSFNHVIRLFNTTTRKVTTVAGTPLISGYENGVPGLLHMPVGVAVSANGTIFVADSENDAIRVFRLNGTVGDLKLQNLNGPAALAIDSQDNLFIADSMNNAIKRVQLSRPPISDLVDPQDRHELYIGIGVGLFAVLLMGIAYQFVARRKRSLGTAEKLTKIRDQRGDASKSVSVAEVSKTVSISRSVAIAVPGYLEIDFERCIKLDISSLSDNKSGGTAHIVRASLKDPGLISKNGLVDVAVKIIRQNPGSNFSKEDDDQFFYEITLMSSLPDSPYLVKMLGYSLKPRSIVMKYYQFNLNEFLDNPAFFQLKDGKFRAALDVAHGLQIVHSQNIIHFDIKPANIMVDIKPDLSYNYLICDFGFANFIADSSRQVVAGLKKPTAAGITVRYAAPELFGRTVRSDQVIDKKVDVFAYAMTMYWVFTETKPWGNMKLQEIEERVVSGERPPLEAVGGKGDSSKEDSKGESKSEGLSSKMFKLIERCWAHIPSERPSFDQIISELQEL